MIVHSTLNGLDGSCTVRVEGIGGHAEQTVRWFAAGAAGKHNGGYHTAAARLRWCDDEGNPLAPGADTSTSTIALVRCSVATPW